MRWRLLLEEYNPTLKYIQGKKNVMADHISRVNTNSTCPTEIPVDQSEEILALVPEELEVRFPMETETIRMEQQKETKKDKNFRL